MFVKRTFRIHLPPSPRSQLLFRRYESQSRPTPTQQKIGSSPAPSAFVEEHLAEHTVSVLGFARRFIKLSLVGLFALGLTGLTAFEGAHMWVEHVGLAGEDDQDACRWEWDMEAERWGGDPTRGGTDSALGYRARHTVRGAWMAQNWGIGRRTSVIGSNAYSGKGPTGAGGLNIVDSRLERAQDFLSTAIAIAESKTLTGKLHPRTMVELLTRHAAILERMGSLESLSQSKSQYERAWAGLPGRGIHAARTAAKLGDLNYRLGEADDALAWWTRALQLSQGGTGKQIATIPFLVPESAPSSPLAQRTLISTLVSLSAFYATSGQLREAQAIEETSLNMLRSIPPPESLASASPPQALHALFLLHRSSLISIHLAEVLFALRNPVAVSLQWLSSAAESSERVALALTGLPLIDAKTSPSKSAFPSSSERPVLSVYSKSISMSKPASSLLRDARRTAAEAWNLMGVLTETKDSSSPERALECYERAIRWAGIGVNESGDNGNIGEPGEGTLESEWKVLLGNYTRAKSAVKDAIRTQG